MCPACLATMGLYAAGAASAGGVTTYLAAKFLRKPRDRSESTTTEGRDHHAATDDRIER